MLETGETAPDFTLPDENGEDVTLSALAGTTVVLYFYPKADPWGKIGSNGCRSSNHAPPRYRHNSRLAGRRARRREIRLARRPGGQAPRHM
ncbi:redoxin domain-containing protein [Solirubrobacter taibaiensis]|nr:redoxin domain-containing protein [Solirubrobacter taibaiensis]